MNCVLQRSPKKLSQRFFSPTSTILVFTVNYSYFSNSSTISLLFPSFNRQLRSVGQAMSADSSKLNFCLRNLTVLSFSPLLISLPQTSHEQMCLDTRIYFVLFLFYLYLLCDGEDGWLMIIWIFFQSCLSSDYFSIIYWTCFA